MGAPSPRRPGRGRLHRKVCLDEGVAELVAELGRRLEGLALHRTHADTEDNGYLTLGEVEGEPEHQACPTPRRQTQQRRLDVDHRGAVLVVAVIHGTAL